MKLIRLGKLDSMNGPSMGLEGPKREARLEVDDADVSGDGGGGEEAGVGAEGGGGGGVLEFDLVGL